jgi:DNA-binding IclR family transcriptional regulator
VAKATSEDREEPQGVLLRALRVLRAFEAQEAPQSLSELARAVDLAPSTTSRLLNVLVETGFVARGVDRRYQLGPRVVSLGLLALRRISLHEVALPHLYELAAVTGESANLGVPAEDRVMYLAHVPSNEPIRHVEWAGSTVPVEGTAIGRALRGDVGPAGFVSTRRTVESGVTAIAAPVRGAAGAIVAGISVTGPTFRISDDDIGRLGHVVVEHASELARQLGHVEGSAAV